jgi:DNA-binding GntR family transcriptional regulator
MMTSGGSILTKRRHLTKQQYVYQTLREGIIHGDLRPGERLVIHELARRLDISIIPVREALRLLESEALVVSVAHVGATVAPVSRQSVVEVFALLEGLETVSTRMVVDVATSKDIAVLDRLVYEMDCALDLDQQGTWAELNSRFHLAIGSLSGMPMVEQMLARALDHWDRIRRFFFRGVLIPRAQTAQSEHREMLAQMKARDAEGIERTMRAHNRSALAAYLAYLDSTAADGVGAGLAGAEHDR